MVRASRSSQLRSWQAPFVLSAALLVVGAAVWAFWLDPDVSVIVAPALRNTWSAAGK
jgi:hypothetical protein